MTEEIKDNMAIWNEVSRPPESALKKITGGRLSGKSDINPQWRYEAMTKLFGVCGINWSYTVDKKWIEPAPDGQFFAFVDITLYFKQGEKWSCGIPANGGAMLIEKEKTGLHANDEAYKMATTDALGTAMKMLGIAADIYAGKWDGSKYVEKPEPKVIPKHEKTSQADVKVYGKVNQETDVPNMEEPDSQLIDFQNADLQGQVLTLKAMCATKKYTPKENIDTMPEKKRIEFFKYLRDLK
jgi:hypothetical protein